jgi:hypothetical protein
METAEMGRVLTEVTIYNLGDLFDARAGRISVDRVRQFVIPDAVVSSNVTGLVLPEAVITRLGLHRDDTGRYEAVRLEIIGREMTVDVTTSPDCKQVVVGFTVLGALDLVADGAGRKLVPNPAHGGEHILELPSVWFEPDAG